MVLDKKKCIGCRQCLEACPLGMPQFDADGVMQICDICLDRLEQGQRPICVESCPARALRWGETADLSRLAASRAPCTLLP